jgi:23S rRNA pseudouridine2605 synthase
MKKLRSNNPTHNEKASHPSPGSVRLNKYIAQSGHCSRRHADQFIRAQLVRVNGKTITEMGTMINPRGDTVVVDGKTIRPFQDQVYVMFNKPPRIVTTMNDPLDRPKVADFFDKAKVRLFPVGRLDWDSEGLLLLTNDGDFAQRVSHPKNDVAKTYLVKVDGQPSNTELQKLMRGVSIIGGKTSALFCERAERSTSDKYDWIKVIINEGRNRQIRQMFAKIGYDVMKLQRTAIGRLRLGPLEKGKFRVLTMEDVERIFKMPNELDERAMKKAAERAVKADESGDEHKHPARRGRVSTRRPGRENRVRRSDNPSSEQRGRPSENRGRAERK